MWLLGGGDERIQATPNKQSLATTSSATSIAPTIQPLAQAPAPGGGNVQLSDVHHAIHANTTRIQDSTRQMIEANGQGFAAQLEELRGRVVKLESAAADKPVMSESLKQVADAVKRDLQAQRRQILDLCFKVDHLDHGGEPSKQANDWAIAPRTSPGDLNALTARVDEMGKTLRMEMDTLRNFTETATVKGGLLCVAVSECTREDKLWVYKQLRAREASLPAMPSGDMTFAVTLQAREIAGQVAFVNNLGLRVSDGHGSDGLLVEGIGEGLLQEWNERNPDKKVVSGDIILEVNGQKGTSCTLEMVPVGQIKLLVQRRAAAGLSLTFPMS